MQTPKRHAKKHRVKIPHRSHPKSDLRHPTKADTLTGKRMRIDTSTHSIFHVDDPRDSPYSPNGQSRPYVLTNSAAPELLTPLSSGENIRLKDGNGDVSPRENIHDLSESDHDMMDVDDSYVASSSDIQADIFKPRARASSGSQSIPESKKRRVIATPRKIARSSQAPKPAALLENDWLAEERDIRVQGNAAYKEARYQDALDIYAKSPVMTCELAMNQAAAYMQLCRYPEAIDRCRVCFFLRDSAGEINPDSTPRHWIQRYFVCLLADGHIEKAKITAHSLSSQSAEPYFAELAARAEQVSVLLETKLAHYKEPVPETSDSLDQETPWMKPVPTKGNLAQAASYGSTLFEFVKLPFNTSWALSYVTDLMRSKNFGKALQILDSWPSLASSSHATAWRIYGLLCVNQPSEAMSLIDMLTLRNKSSLRPLIPSYWLVILSYQQTSMHAILKQVRSTVAQLDTAALRKKEKFVEITDLLGSLFGHIVSIPEHYFFPRILARYHFVRFFYEHPPSNANKNLYSNLALYMSQILDMSNKCGPAPLEAHSKSLYDGLVSLKNASPGPSGALPSHYPAASFQELLYPEKLYLPLGTKMFSAHFESSHFFSAESAKSNPDHPWEPHFAVLGLKSTSTRRQVRSRFRTLSLKSHPDKGGDPELFKRYAAAYAFLMDRLE